MSKSSNIWKLGTGSYPVGARRFSSWVSGSWGWLLSSV